MSRSKGGGPRPTLWLRHDFAADLTFVLDDGLAIRVDDRAVDAGFSGLRRALRALGRRARERIAFLLVFLDALLALGFRNADRLRRAVEIGPICLKRS